MPPDVVSRSTYPEESDRYWFLFGTTVLGIALVGYFAIRVQLPIVGANELSLAVLEPGLWTSMPSLLHCLAFCCFTYALLPKSLSVAFGCAIFWAGIHSLYESPLIGAVAAQFARWQTISDPVDALFAVLGAAIFFANAALRLRCSSWRTSKHER